MIASRLALAAIAASALNFGSACQAQQANTNCAKNPSGGVDCKTTQVPARDPDHCAGVGLFEQAASGCTGAEIKAATARIALRKKVGTLIADGKCDEATKAALEAGDFDLADKAKGYCPTAH